MHFQLNHYYTLKKLFNFLEYNSDLIENALEQKNSNLDLLSDLKERINKNNEKKSSIINKISEFNSKIDNKEKYSD
jgi:hypothetical protein